MNALLDYGSSSSSTGNESSDEERSKVEDRKNDEKPKLPKPALGENTLNTSVFSNPFVAEEQAKAAILEKHVKMVYVDFLL
ncbi:unnamed protein product [Euphydryas editha]|uniref:Uncharacterized protein n=1 Tax=Euphydryas editha TaxID=104508 RepID=A0AAU9UV92_EUPED|nr:unnamed protein product [Euphydryas editha]